MATGRIHKLRAQTSQLPTGRIHKIRSQAVLAGGTGRIHKVRAVATGTTAIVVSVEPYATVTLPSDGSNFTADSDGIFSIPAGWNVDADGIVTLPAGTTPDTDGIVATSTTTWTQTSGPAVTVPTFTAPALFNGAVLKFSAASGSTAEITVYPHSIFLGGNTVPLRPST